MQAANSLKINEIFQSVQGEGKYAGTPMLFIRLAGCNLKCDFCDTNHKKFRKASVKRIARLILDTGTRYVCWTGGEPTLQMDAINEVIKLTLTVSHHLETNGTYLGGWPLFSHVVVSPKTPKFIRPLMNYEVKVVTDLDKVNVDLIGEADALMPLTTSDPEKNLEIKQRVWDYCVANNIRYSPRLHLEVGKR